MINTQYINLNMTPSGVLPVLHCSQYDIGRPLGVVVYDGSAEMDLDDYTVTIEATRTDGTPITAAVTTDGNVGAFVTTATMTNKDDLYPAQLVIVDGDSNRVASLPFMMRVVKAAMDENSEAIEEDAPLYQQYNAAIQALIVAVRADLNAEVAARETAIAAETAARVAADNTLQSNINSEASTRATQDAVLSARMDTFASLPSGSTSGNAELLDIRVAANGKTYPSAGDAVRGQASYLDKGIVYLRNALMLTGNEEVFVNATWEQGLISSSTGENTSDGAANRCRTVEYFTSDVYINVDRSVVPYGTYLYYYDDNRNFIKREVFNITESVIPDPQYPYYRVAILDFSNFDNPISAADAALNYVFYRHLSFWDDMESYIDSTANDLIDGGISKKTLYVGALENGHLTASGTVVDSFSDYRLSTTEVVALPRGSNRKITVGINTNYLIAMRTGVAANNLNNNLYWFTDGDTITIPDGDNYYGLSICYNLGPTDYRIQTLTPSETERINLRLYYTDYTKSDNDDAEKMMDAARLTFSNSAPNNLTTIPLVAHTSDCHGDYQRVKNFLDFCDKTGIDLACITGDMVAYTPAQGLGWFSELVNEAKTLCAVCIGNHDVYDSSMTDAQAYSFVFGDIAAKIGNLSNKSYYYIDIADKHLRMISVNLYEYGGTTRNYTHFSETQLTWLCNTLLSTPSGYGVILLYHSPQVSIASAGSATYPTFYQSIRKYNNVYSGVTGSPINDIIDAFIGRTTISQTYTQTGSPASVTVSADFSEVDPSVEFIAHLTGHFHQDTVCYVPGTTHLQLMLNVPCTNALYGGGIYPYLCDLTDLPRNKLDSTQDCFNVYAIDRANQTVKIIRVGSNITYQMEERKYMEIPYK